MIIRYFNTIFKYKLIFLFSDATGKLMKPRGSDGSLDHVIGSAAFQKVQRRNDSDSGRGESESETHSRNHHVSISRKESSKNQLMYILLR